jgi:ferredoxin
VKPETFTVNEGWLGRLVDSLRGRDVRVIAPVRENDLILFGEVGSAEEIAAGHLNTLVPAKSILFPQTETLFRYRIRQGGVDIAPESEAEKPTVVLGVRPCDAAGISRVTTVFRWDYDDAHYLRRLDDTTVVTFACTEPDEFCFCTSVGIGPSAPEGSDVLVRQAGEATVIEALTEKGKRLVSEHVQDAGDGAAAAEARDDPSIERRFDAAAVSGWLADNFESDLWKEISLRCLGCGACSYLCPTCHCFDIVEEADWARGERRRNWDCCAFSLFTLHASGHNPRPTQEARWRQRIMHKFLYFPERFEAYGCVGCGRCVRECGVSQDIISILGRIGELSNQ